MANEPPCYNITLYQRCEKVLRNFQIWHTVSAKLRLNKSAYYSFETAHSECGIESESNTLIISNKPHGV